MELNQTILLVCGVSQTSSEVLRALSLSRFVEMNYPGLK